MPSATPRVRRSEVVATELTNNRRELLSTETILDTLDEKIVVLGEKISKAAPGPEKTAWETEMKGFEARHQDIQEKYHALGKHISSLRGKEKVITEINQQPLTELFVQHTELKQERRNGGPILTGDRKKLKDRLDVIKKTQGDLEDYLIPVAPTGEEIPIAVIETVKTTLEKHAIDTTELEAKLSAYNQAALAFAKRTGKDASVRTAKKNLLATFAAFNVQVEADLEAAKAAEESARAKAAPGHAETTEKIIWTEEALVRKIADPKERKSYLEQRMAVQEGIARGKVAETLLDTPEKQEAYAKNILQSLGIPANKAALEKLFSDRETAAKIAKANAKTAADKAAIPYKKNQFGEEMIQEVQAVLSPDSLDEEELEKAKKRLISRGVMFPNPHPQEIIALLGLKIVPKGVDRDKALQALEEVLTNFVEVKQEKDGAPWLFTGTDEDLEQIYTGFKGLLADPAGRDYAFKTIGAGTKVTVDPKPIEKELDDLKAAIEKARPLEAKERDIETILVRVDKLQLESLPDLEKKMEPHLELKKKQEAVVAKQEKVKEDRKKEKDRLAKQLDEEIQKNDEELDKTRTRLTDPEALQKELAAAVAEFNTKNTDADRKTTELAMQTIQRDQLRLFCQATSDPAAPDVFQRPKDLTDFRRQYAAILNEKLTNQVTGQPENLTAKELVGLLPENSVHPIYIESLKAKYPVEYHDVPEARLYGKLDAIEKQCDYIEHAATLAEAAIRLADQPKFPGPFTKLEPPKPIPAPSNGPFLTPAPPKPSFFNRVDPAPYAAWVQMKKIWENTNEQIKTANARAEAAYKAVHDPWRLEKELDERQKTAWEEQVRSIGRMLNACPVGLIGSPVDLHLKADYLLADVSRACMAGLAVLMPRTKFEPRTPKQSLNARRAEIIAMGSVDPAHYKNLKAVLKHARHNKVVHDEVIPLLNTFLKEKRLQEANLTRQSVTTTAEKDRFTKEQAEAAKKKADLEQEKNNLTAFKKQLEEAKPVLLTKRTTELRQHDEQTDNLVKGEDPDNVVDAWKKEAYDYSGEQTKLREELKKTMLASIQWIIEWNATAAAFPEKSDSVTYLTAREGVIEGLEQLKTFLRERGEVVADGLNDLPKLKTRVEQIFNGRGAPDRALEESILKTLPILTESLRKVATP